VTDSIEATIARILKHVPSAISKLRPDVPVGLDEVLAKALEKDPERRFTDAAAFAHTLRSLNGQTDEALALRLQASVGADFRDPRIAVALDVPDLASLDRSWREYSDDGVMASSQKAQSVSPPTVVHPTGSHPGATRSQIAARPNGPRGRNVLPWVVGALVSLLAIGGGLWVRTYRDRMESVAPPPAVIIVDGRVSGADGLVLDAGSSATPPASTSQSSADPTPPPRTVPPIPPTAVTHAQNGGGGGGADGLTRAFARQQPQVARCFDANAAELSGAPKIEIRFDVDASGHVSSAQVLPAAIAPTPLGACLAGVARATQFGPQASSVSFRIPITATAHRGP